MIYKAHSHAKINLFLYNLGKRADGYHELYTLFYETALYDEITIKKSGKRLLSCNMPDIPTDDSNLIMKVDSLLRQKFGLKDFYDIFLNKKIPTGAGLGGGSSNAAAYLNLVNEAGGLGLDLEDKIDILSQIGSDAPFFLYGNTALGRSRGEVLTPVTMEKLYVLLVCPKIFVSTAKVFSSKKLELTTLDNTNMIPSSLTLKELVRYIKNDLEKPVFEEYPEIFDIKQRLLEYGALASIMSGSGSSVFGVYACAASLNEAYSRVINLFPEYIVEKV